MLVAIRSRTTTLAVLVAYFAAHALGALLHEHLHAHPSGESCCHAHDHSGHSHAPRCADTSGDHHVLVAAESHDACIVCRLAGQPVTPAVAMPLELSAPLSAERLPCPAAAPRSLSQRLAHSRAPPAVA